MNTLSPIILFTYNRPEHTRKTVEALARNELASESILYVFSDGPKENAGEIDINNITTVREIIHSIKGFKDVIITEQPRNVGLDTSIINGVTQVINKHGRCITIEDDIVTHPWFLRFINECLDKYENDKRIWMIGGYNVRMKIPFWYEEDVYLAHRCCSWGWGIWKDRWDSIDWNMNGYSDFLNNRKLRKKFCRGGDDMMPMLIDQMKYEVPAWDIRWDYTLMNKNGYVIRPVKSLVINYGLDGTGVHCGIEDSFAVAAKQPEETSYNIHLPRKIRKSLYMERSYKLFMSPDASISHKLKRKIYRLFSGVKKRIHLSLF